MTSLDPELVREAKAIVLWAFRNGPIENIHSGNACPVCYGKEGYMHITQAWMREIMKEAVNRVYRLLYLEKHQPAEFERWVVDGVRLTQEWDDPMPDSS
jgi:hypothetical protein